jgi:peptidoglycan/LPS O-acetylase OafA/YrhL
MLVFLEHKTGIAHGIGLGGFGVRLFFVLSGYLIIGILVGQRRRIERGISSFRSEWSDFNIRRAFRNQPPYFLVDAVVALAFDLDRWLVLRFVTYTENLDIAFRTFVYPEKGGLFWSLCVEEQFYLLSAPLFLALPSRHALKACWAMIGLAIACTIALDLAGFPGRTIYVGPSNFGLMALGGIIALTMPKHGKHPALGMVWLALFLLAAAGTHSLPHWASYVIGLGLAPLCVALAIRSIVLHQASFLVRGLDFAPIRRLGRVSYVFYLVHAFVSFGGIAGLPRIATLALDLGVTVAICAVSWRFFETPLLAYGRSLVARRRQRATVSAAMPSASPLGPE